MNPTLRKFFALAEEAEIHKKTLSAQEKFMRLVSAQPELSHRKVTANLPPVATLRVGSLVTFSYYAKTAEKLPWWDRYPLVLVTSINEDGWTGINLHYIHPRMRARLLYEQNKRNIPIIDSEVGNLCIKRYLAKQVSGRPREFPEEYHDIAIQLPFEMFEKATKQQVWKDTRKRSKK